MMLSVSTALTILAPFAVTGLTILGSRWVSQQSLNHQRRLSDLGAARELIDEGAPMIQRTTELLITVTQGYRGQGHEMFAIPALAEAFDSLDLAANELGAQSMRLDIRLGPAHQCGKSLELMCGAVGQVLSALRRGRLGIMPTAERSAEDAARIQRAGKQYFAELGAYIIAAHRTIGAELPGVDRTMLGEENDLPPSPSPALRLKWALIDHLPLPGRIIARLEGSPLRGVRHATR